MKILFISHEASLSGAPKVLLNLIKWIKEHYPNWILDIVMQLPGNKEDEFKKNASRYFLILEQTRHFTVYDQIMFGIKKKMGLKNESFKEKMFHEIYSMSYDIIFCNTVVSLKTGIIIKERLPKAKLVCHVHEMEAVAKMCVPNVDALLQKADKIIAVSKSVQDDLCTVFNVEKSKTVVIHEFIDDEVLQTKKLKKALEKGFMVGGSGQAHWRKGCDLFIQVAHKLKKILPNENIRFLWVGYISSVDKIIYDADIRKLGLQGYVEFMGETEEPLKYFSEFDLLLMTSREDPFPLVCIEVAILEKPIICFQKAGGSNELISEGGGKSVSYLDTDAMAEEVKHYFLDRNKLALDGKKIGDSAKQYVTSVQAPKVVDMLISLSNA